MTASLPTLKIKDLLHLEGFEPIDGNSEAFNLERRVLDMIVRKTEKL